MIHGALPEVPQYTPDSLMRDVQQSSGVKPSSLPRPPQPVPPHVPHPRAQQKMPRPTPTIPLLHVSGAVVDVGVGVVIGAGVGVVIGLGVGAKIGFGVGAMAGADVGPETGIDVGSKTGRGRCYLDLLGDRAHAAKSFNTAPGCKNTTVFIWNRKGPFKTETCDLHWEWALKKSLRRRLSHGVPAELLLKGYARAKKLPGGSTKLWMLLCICQGYNRALIGLRMTKKIDTGTTSSQRKIRPKCG